jgi:quercetin dioxygenase-like cupin family protein
VERAVDLAAGDGRGPLVGLATEDLNLTLLSWPAGHVLPDHVNTERDVAYVVVAGSAEVEVDGRIERLVAPAALVVTKGARRELRAGPDGVRYVTVHRARGGLEITRSS